MDVAPGGEFAVAVFTQDVTMNVAAVYAKFLAQQVAEASGVQISARTNDAFGGEAGNLLDDARHYVNWVGDDQDNCIRAGFL